MADQRVAAIPASGDDAAERRRARRATWITLGVLGALVSAVVLLTPVTDSGTATELTTRKYGPGNARLAADLARKLGWKTRISTQPLLGSLDTTVIYAVFEGPTPMPTPERLALLSAVERGAGLLVAPGGGESSRLMAALGLYIGRPGAVQATPLGDCPASTDAFAKLRVRSRMLTFDTVTRVKKSAPARVHFPRTARVLLSSEVPLTADDSTDATVTDSTARNLTAIGSKTTDSTASDSAARDSVTTDTTATDLAATDTTEARPTVVAFPLGTGRVVATADPDVLRTDQMRNCAMGPALTVVRSLEYLSVGRERTIVFAEYYQNAHNNGPSVVVGEWLRGTALGRMLLTMLAAGLLLLLARGRRTLAPVYRVREERRSALEHVDALATAWRAVRGTRTVARMLARGIRRRHAAGRWRSLDDITFLAALAERHPSIASDVARLTAAIESPSAPSDLPALRQAAAHIDAECLTP